MHNTQLRQMAHAELGVILNAIPQPIIIKDEHSRIRLLNDAACALLGKSREDLIGRTDREFLPAAEADRIREMDEQVLRTGDELSFEEDIALADGTVRNLVIQKRLAISAREGSKDRLIVATISDVTASRRAERELRASEDHYRSLVELHPQVPWIANPSGEVLEVGPRWKEITGIEAADALGTGWVKAMHPDDLECVWRQWTQSIATGRPLDAEFRLATAEGYYRWYRNRAAARRADDGTIFLWYGIVENVDDCRRALAALTESEARFKAIADDAPVMIWVTDESGANTYNSRLWLETTGQTAEQAQGFGWADAIHPEDRQGVEAGFHAAFRLRQRSRVEYRLRRADGGCAWVIDVGQPRFASDGRFLGYVGVVLDITERRNAEDERFRAQKQIYHMVRYDALTGLPNRQFLREAFDHLLDPTARAKTVVLRLDLDGLKAVNDAYGRSIGDLLLRRVAERLRKCLKKSDILARLGGDEFVVVRTGMRHDVEATKLAQEIIEAIGTAYDLEGTLADIGVNVGLALFPKDGQSLDQLIKAADIALYQAKASGRGTYKRIEPGMDAQLKARQEMKVSLRHALKNRALELHYQPLINLHTGRITSCEALVRWKHPEKGPVSPAEFIPIAEETGLIGPLGEWILRQACTEAAKWPSQVSVAVNLSPLQFRNRRLASVIRDILSETGLEASRLQLEITESVFLNDSASNLLILQQIRQLGAKIAMDDFGTGYSSLSYLRSFRFDKIKVDRSFIADLPTGRESLAIIRAVAGIGRTLGITTTVEGVETQTQLDAINAEGFDEAQGYLFARPVPASQILEIVQSSRE